MGFECLTSGQIQASGEATDPAEDLDRAQVEIGTLARPRVNQVVDFVPHCVSVPIRQES